MSTREEREAAAGADTERVYWALWEENHYPKPSFRKSAITERVDDAERLRIDPVYNAGTKWEKR